MASIRFERPDQLWGSRARKYRLLVDGDEVGRVASGSVFEVDVEPGTHTVQARIDWTGSPSEAVTIGVGEEVIVRILNGAEGIKRFLGFG